MTELRTLSRSLPQANDAFDEQDVEKSIQAHQAQTDRKEPHTGQAGEYIEATVFGGLDGIVTTFAIVVAAVGANLTYTTVLILGFANLVADAVGMAIGDFLSSRAEDDQETQQRRKLEVDIRAAPDHERTTLVNIYKSKGFSDADADEIVSILARSPLGFTDTKLIQEFSILPKGDSSAPWKGALVTFTAFIILGGIPMIPYLAAGKFTEVVGMDYIFWISVVLFAICLFTLGAYRGKITGKRWYVTGGVMLINGGITTVISFIVGFYLEKVSTTSF
eukprot:TRINITY_DN3584_c0_g1_i1.p1 TRINITY_DN3584_c0_g1~~TRINITY_DN3584_c0_g1_i1.p1  ORF type:complete len:277 (-),score=29.33 TRINITY_DN3584_c0_g1_i1:59-889(-)